MSSGSYPTAAPGLSLSKVASQLSQAWFPVNNRVLELVQDRLNDGYYHEHREDLLQDLKGDCALYLLCLRELTLMLRKTNVGDSQRISILSFSEMLQDSGIEQIRLMLNNSSKLSVHSFENASRLQIERLEECILSASASELLAEKFGIDRRVGFNSALLRQLGLALIAWNYPNVYRQSLEIVTEAQDADQTLLDNVIQSILGFSPSVLGVKVVQSWGLAQSVASVIGPSALGNDDLNALLSKESAVRYNEGKTELLEKICAVGEAFARANNPGRYPSAQADWQSAEKVIRCHLGSEGLRMIRHTAVALGEHYATAFPALFQTVDGEIEISTSGSDHFGARKYEANVFLKACHRDVRRRFWLLYSRLEGGVSDRLLREFIHDLTPAFGFDVSSVFLVEPASETLVPVLKTGSPSFVKSKPISLTEPGAALNPLRKALPQRAPVLEEGIVGGKRKLFYAGSIGIKTGIGVLYVELSPNAPEAVRQNPTMVFQALRQCLHDLLQLS